MPKQLLVVGVLLQPVAHREPVVGDGSHTHHTRHGGCANTENRVEELALMHHVGRVGDGAGKGTDASKGARDRVCQGRARHAREGAP